MSEEKTITNELESLIDFLKTVYPNASYERQNVPDKTYDDLFVVAFMGGYTQPDTGTSVLNEREWTIAYFGKDTQTVLEVANKVVFEFHKQRGSIPIRNSSGRLLVTTQIGEKFETKSADDKEGIEIYLETRSRESIHTETSNPIKGISPSVR